MPQKTCETCGEIADAAKAFCPGCGSPFETEEQRQDVSEFDQLGNTVNLGQTMYNQMLSDMGLDLQRSKGASPRRIEVIQPVAEPERPQQPSQVAAPPSAPPVVKKGRKHIWLIVGAAVVVMLILILVILAAVLYMFWPVISKAIRG